LNFNDLNFGRGFFGKELFVFSVFQHGFSLFKNCHHFLAVLMVVGLAGCSNICRTGALPEGSEIDLGPAVQVRVCLYKDGEVSDQRAAGIVKAIQEEFAQYGLIVMVPSIREWEPSSFKQKGILGDIAAQRLEPPFDRNLVLVGRSMGDFLSNQLLPEIFGAVETWTHTKGFVIAEMGFVNPLLNIKSPHRAAVHQFYHMLGVEHEDGREVICEKIARLKRLAIENRKSGRDFFPGISSKGKLYMSRNAVDRRFGLVPKTTMAQRDKAVMQYSDDR
jgi:hypothetical protein